MKLRLILTTLVCLFTTNMFAQLPNGSIAPDFTATDIEGNEWNLYQLLDEGHTVILNFFATWCGPCWSYADSGVLAEMYNTFGPNGSGDIYVFAIEADPSTTLDDINGTGSQTIGNWTEMHPYPIIDDEGSIFNDYQGAYYPTIYTICQDYTLVESGQSDFDTHIQFAFEGCANTISGTAVQFHYNGETSSCGGSEWNASVELINMGTDSISSATFSVFINDLYQNEITWYGVLDSGFSENIDLGPYLDTGTLSITLTEVNGNEWNANKTVAITGSVDSSNNVQVRIMTDNWPEETGWSITDGLGTEIAGSPVGDYSNQQNTLFTYNVSLNMEECYTFTLLDSYGDGLYSSQWGNYTDGYAQVVSMDDETELEYIFDYQGASGFQFSEVAIGIYPTLETGFGCTDELACNYDPNALIPDEDSCEYPEEGYDCEGYCLNDEDWDGICDEFEIPGCTDPEADNYNEEATDDDGSCFYFTPSCDNMGSDMWEYYNTAIYPEVTNALFGIYLSQNLALNINELLIDETTGQNITVIDLYITEVNGLPGSLTAEFDGSTFYPLDQTCINISGTPFEVGEYYLDIVCVINASVFGMPIEFEVDLQHYLVINENPNPIPGCTYTNASNYNVYANEDDGSCVFFGCTDSEAGNYNPLANFDDGTCEEGGSSSSCVSDINEDGSVTTQDLLLLLADYGSTCE